MRVLEDLADVHFDFDTVLTFGAFDGVHIGHQAVIDEVVANAGLTDRRSVVLSFYPHPKRFLDPGNCPPCLTARHKKIALIKSLGVDILLLVRLEGWLSQMQPREFIEDVLCDRLSTRHIIVGYDSEFGYRRQGNARVLQEIAAPLEVAVDIISPRRIGGEVISSTRVRETIAAGELRLASRMLGRNHSVQAKVIVGQKLGRQIGFPTANLLVEDQMLPSRGVYAVYTRLDGSIHKAVLNIGTRPTFHGTCVQIEAHLLDFDRDIYGEVVEIEFVERIRDERQFETVELLVTQIRQDIAVAGSLLER